MESNKVHLEMEVLRKFRLIFGAVKTHFHEIEKICGISSSQLWILKVINNNPGIGVTDLAKIMAIHQTTASILIEKLSKKKLIEKRRSDIDQRRVGLFTNIAGEITLNKAPQALEGLIPSTLQKLTNKSLTELNFNLDELIKHFDSKYQDFANTPLAEL